jgi:hypothetical protein
MAAFPETLKTFRGGAARDRIGARPVRQRGRSQILARVGRRRQRSGFRRQAAGSTRSEPAPQQRQRSFEKSGEAARIQAERAEAALEELRRPFWRRWIG